MGLVRAKKDVYLTDHGYVSEGEVFEYTGPDNTNLESTEKKPYFDLSLDELKDELTHRKLRFAASTTKENLREQLVADDKRQRIESDRKRLDEEAK